MPAPVLTRYQTPLAKAKVNQTQFPANHGHSHCGASLDFRCSVNAKSDPRVRAALLSRCPAWVATLFHGAARRAFTADAFARVFHGVPGIFFHPFVRVYRSRETYIRNINSAPGCLPSPRTWPAITIAGVPGTRMSRSMPNPKRPSKPWVTPCLPQPPIPTRPPRLPNGPKPSARRCKLCRTTCAKPSFFVSGKPCR